MPQSQPERALRVTSGAKLGDEAQALPLAMGTVDLAAVLDAWPECARVLTPAGEVVHVNPPGLELEELELEQALGRSWPLLWPPESRGPMQDAIAAAAQGNVGSFRGLSFSHSGKRLWLDTVVSPVRDTSGAIVNLLAV